MANGKYSQSHSPIRAIAAASHPVAGIAPPKPRAWGDVLLPESELDGAFEPESHVELRRHPLACPECGTALSLRLLAKQAAHHGAPRIAPAVSHMPLDQFDEAVNTFKRELIARALKENGSVMTRAAKALGLKYTTFVAMAHRLGITKNGSCDDCPEDFGA
jgi:DNA-binding NtrC family response regulator